MRNDIEYRIIKIIDDNTIDIMLNHPVYGWIPFTAYKNDVEEHGRSIYQDIIKTDKYREVDK